MVVISKSVINQYCENHADVCNALENWYRTVGDADWSNLKDMKDTFNSVDYVGSDRYVFNIKGNRFRLIALVFFSVRTVYIKFIGTHAEYDKINALTVNLKRI